MYNFSYSSRMIIQDIIQRDQELKQLLAPILQYMDFVILGIDRSIVCEYI